MRTHRGASVKCRSSGRQEKNSKKSPAPRSFPSNKKKNPKGIQGSMGFQVKIIPILNIITRGKKIGKSCPRTKEPRADALTGTTSKNTSLKCVAPRNTGIPDLWGKLGGFFCCSGRFVPLKMFLLESYFAENKIRRKTEGEKRSLQPGSNQLS